MFFFSVAIPDILPARPKRNSGSDRTGEKKAHAGMTTEHSADAQGQSGEVSSVGEGTGNDAGTLSVLYVQFRRPIHSYVYRLLCDGEYADNVMQEVVVWACIS